MSAKEKKVTLLTWMALRRDPLFLGSAIALLKKEYNYTVTKVAYLYIEDSSEKPEKRIENKLSAVEDYLNKEHIKFIRVKQDSSTNPSNHDDVLKALLNTLKPDFLKSLGEICINTTGGTPAMHAVWQNLNAMNYFENAKFYNVQRVSPIQQVISLEDYKSGKWKELCVSAVSKAQEEAEICEITIARIAKENDQTIEEVNPLPSSQQEAFGRYHINRDNESTYDLDKKGGALAEAKKLLKTYCQSGMPILILGERGIGKSRLVESCFKKWTNKEVQAENCGAWEKGIAGSEIFGSVEGAFTDAKNREGCLRHASRNGKGGVLFLDEIHHLDKKWQRALLRTLQDENHPFKVQGEDIVRYAKNLDMVFASNKSLEELREYLDADFFDRIAYFVVELPPLRKHPEEIKDHWDSVWQEVCEEKKHVIKEFPATFWCNELEEFFKDEKNLMGNFRSLRVVAHHLLIWKPWDKEFNLKEKEVKKILDRISEINSTNTDSEAPTAETSNASHKLPFEKECTELGLDYNWDNAVDVFKKVLIESAAKKYGSKKTAATELESDPSTFTKHLQKLEQKIKQS